MPSFAENVSVTFDVTRPSSTPAAGPAPQPAGAASPSERVPLPVTGIEAAGGIAAGMLLAAIGMLMNRISKTKSAARR